MDWNEVHQVVPFVKENPVFSTIMVGIIGPGLTRVAAFFLKVPIRRKARRDELLDLLAKEIRVRDALLRLKDLASQPSSAPDKAKATTYKRAEELDIYLNQEVERLRLPRLTLPEPSPPMLPEEEWWRYGSRTLFRPIFEGQKDLSWTTKSGWWVAIGVMVVFIVLYIILEIAFFLGWNQTLSGHEKNVRGFFYALLIYGVGGFYFLYLATQARRAAYAVVYRAVTKKQHPLPLTT